jgi:hypothetical protein
LPDNGGDLGESDVYGDAGDEGASDSAANLCFKLGLGGINIGGDQGGNIHDHFTRALTRN